MSADVEIRVTARGVGKMGKRIGADVCDVLKVYGLLEEFDITDEDVGKNTQEIVFATDGTISISQSYEVLPRLAEDLKALATNGVTIKFETRHHWGDDEPPWVVQQFGAAG